MKQNIWIVAAVVLIVLGLGFAYLASGWLEEPRTSLDRKIDEQVARSTRLLSSYRPVGTRLNAVLNPPATQPSDIPADKWQEYVNAVQQDSPLASALQQQQRELSTLNQRLRQLDGEAPSRSAPSNPAEAYGQLLSDLKYNATLFEDALRAVRDAIQMSEGSGESEVQGNRNPGATRLEAILIDRQADMLRRQAQLQRIMADEQRAHCQSLFNAWQAIVPEVHSIQAQLDQPTATQPTASAEAAPSSDESVIQPAEAKGTEVAGGDQDKPADKRGGLFSAFVERAKQGKGHKGAVESNEPVAAAGKDAAAARKPVEPAKVNPLPRQLVVLATQQKEVANQIAESQQLVQQLEQSVQQTEERLASAQAKAQETERQMLELEQAKRDPSNPQAVDQFTREYESLAEAHRAAFREATILENGSLRNAKSDSEDENEMLTAPLVPANPDEPMSPERGLIPLKRDLQAAQNVLQAQQALAVELAQQVEEIVQQEKAQRQRLAELSQSEQRLVEQTRESARQVVAQVAMAYHLEQQSLDLLDSQGRQAAERAKRAAQERISQANEKRQELSPDAQNDRLEMISKEQFMVAHVEALGGDLAYMTALIESQRYEDGRRQARFLSFLETMKIRAEELVSEGGEKIPDGIVQLASAESSGKESQANATKSLDQALEAYSQAAQSLNNIWTLHAQMAAVQYLKAILVGGSEGVALRQKASDQYRAAIRDRKEMPEAQAYEPVIQNLSTATN